MIKLDKITEIEIKDDVLIISQFDNNEVILTQDNLKKLLTAINYTHSCTDLKTLKQGEKLILDNKFDVEVVAPSEKNVLIKYKETDKVVWVNEQRLKRN